MSDITPAGWQPDPTGRHEHRYWDGTTWTDNVSDAGTAATDPFTDAAAPEAAGATDAPTWGDPTTSTPVPSADATAAWSTTPGAPVPPLPQAAAGSGGDGGSKRGLLIGGGILAALAVAVIAFLALSSDDDKVSTEDLKARMVALFTDGDEIGLSQADAECASDVVIDEIGADRLQDVDFSADDPPPGLEDEFSAAMVKAVQDCNIDLTGGDTGVTTTTEDPGGDTTTTEDTASDGGGTTDFGGSVPDNFEEILADTYENSLGLPRDKAECLAGRLADAIETGELSEDQAASAVFEYLEACDIALDEIGAN